MNRNSPESIMTEPSSIMTVVITLFIGALFLSACYFAITFIAVGDSGGQKVQATYYEKKK